MHSPKVSHMNVSLRLVKYLKSKLGLGILMSSAGNDILTVFCDVDWDSCVNDRKSINGFMIQHGQSPIS